MNINYRNYDAFFIEWAREDVNKLEIWEEEKYLVVSGDGKLIRQKNQFIVKFEHF